jgi:AcrR family transcriptional regulator
MTEPARPVSRRERPAKPPLTRAGIIAAGLAILEEEGMEKVTMRRIAAALDTGAASLYVYVQNTADLHAQILDELLADVRPATSGPWLARLIDLLESYAAVLFEHPEIARISMSTHTSGPHYLRLVDVMLGLLEEGGVPSGQAAWGVDLLLAYPTFLAAERGTRTTAQRAGNLDLADLATHIADADPTVLPHLNGAGLDIVSGTPAERLRWGLTVVINGITRTERPAQRAPDAPSGASSAGSVVQT